jgi:hypothetical protein
VGTWSKITCPTAATNFEYAAVTYEDLIVPPTTITQFIVRWIFVVKLARLTKPSLYNQQTKNNKKNRQAELP